MITATNNGKKVRPEEWKGLVDYLAEINILKRTPRSGWRFAGPSTKVETDDDAGHVAGVAQIAYLLARLEGLDLARALRCMGLALFHENSETRLPDRDRVAAYYVKILQETFTRAMEDQVSTLPKEIGKEILDFATEANYGDTPEAIIAQDADMLEASLQAKIFNERGFTIDKSLLRIYLDERRFQTKSAKRLVSAIRRRKEFPFRWGKKILTEGG